MSDVVESQEEIIESLPLTEEDKALLKNLEKLKTTLEKIKIKDEEYIGKINLKTEGITIERILSKNEEGISESISRLEYISSKYNELPNFVRKYVSHEINNSVNRLNYIFENLVADRYVDEVLAQININIFYGINLVRYYFGEATHYAKAIDEYYEVYLSRKFEDIDKMKDKSENFLKEIQESYEFIKNAQTGSIYIDAFYKYKKSESNFRYLFYLAIIFTFGFVIFYGSPDFSSKEKIIAFIMYKLTIFILGGTLITYFLRLSNFYHLKAEQSYQVHLEIKAFPSYVTGLSPNDVLSLRKDLAPLYFGKSIDDRMHNGINSILQDQVKSSTDALKSVTDMMKISTDLKKKVEEDKV